MLLTMLKGKIHRATVTEACLDYVGSITIDEHLMKAAGLLEHEQVDVLNVNNGVRLTTYVIKGRAGSGVVCLNGPAARLALPGDKVIILAYALLSPEEAAKYEPAVVFVDEKNQRTGGKPS
ncbi:MAG TPA: aspartate 1-decarboxylase [Candidatus Ozemobacteraceae bacterium]|nr:aspartate 1-decarboxylase [Candidatus Ozemobacteraceae bacterium]